MAIKYLRATIANLEFMQAISIQFATLQTYSFDVGANPKSALVFEIAWDQKISLASAGQVCVLSGSIGCAIRAGKKLAPTVPMRATIASLLDHWIGEAIVGYSRWLLDQSGSRLVEPLASLPTHLASSASKCRRHCAEATSQ